MYIIFESGPNMYSSSTNSTFSITTVIPENSLSSYEHTRTSSSESN